MSTIKVENIRIASEAVSRPVTGVAAAWCNASNSAVISDSLNVSSGVDNGTGDYTYPLTNAFSAYAYSQPSTARLPSGNARIAMMNTTRGTASVIAIYTTNQENSAFDISQVFSALGELA